MESNNYDFSDTDDLIAKVQRFYHGLVGAGIVSTLAEEMTRDYLTYELMMLSVKFRNEKGWK